MHRTFVLCVLHMLSLDRKASSMANTPEIPTQSLLFLKNLAVLTFNLESGYRVLYSFHKIAFISRTSCSSLGSVQRRADADYGCTS